MARVQIRPTTTQQAQGPPGAFAYMTPTLASVRADSLAQQTCARTARGRHGQARIRAIDAVAVPRSDPRLCLCSGVALSEHRTYPEKRHAACGSDNSVRASAAVAGRRPYWAQSSATCRTSAAFDGASVSRSRRTLSSSPVRQCPPSSSDQRASVSWSRPMPAPVHVASGARRLQRLHVELEDFAVHRHRVLHAHHELDVLAAPCDLAGLGAASPPGRSSTGRTLPPPA